MEDCRIFLRQLDPLAFRLFKGTAECFSEIFRLHQDALVDLGFGVSKHVESKLLEKRVTRRRSRCSFHLVPRKVRRLPPPWGLIPQAAVLWANCIVYMPRMLVNQSGWTTCWGRRGQGNKVTTHEWDLVRKSSRRPQPDVSASITTGSTRVRLVISAVQASNAPFG